MADFDKNKRVMHAYYGNSKLIIPIIRLVGPSQCECVHAGLHRRQPLQVCLFIKLTV